jgi:predicted Zn-dependent protease
MAEAEEHLKAAVRLNPDLSAARFNLGFFLVEKGAVAEAIAELEAAHRLDPKDPETSELLRSLKAR